jgi:zinc protease
MPVTRSDPGYYPLQGGLNVLSGAFYASKLSRDLREHCGLVYTVEAFIDAGKTRSIFGVVYGSDPQNVQTARTMVGRDLKEMQNKPVNTGEHLQAKTILVSQLLLAMESTGN